MAYYPSLLIGRQAPKLIIRIEISAFCVCPVFTLILSTLVGRPAAFSGYFAGTEYIAVRGVLLLLPDGVLNFVRSVGCFLIMFDYIVNPVEALSYI